MARNFNQTNAVANVQESIVAKKEAATGFTNLVNSPVIQKKFKEVLADSAPGFLASLMSLHNNSDMLMNVTDKTTILAAAMTAATMKLPINPNLGLAYIVPYRHKDKNTGTYVIDAQFQIGYRGLIQLAIRTGQYRKIHAGLVHEGEVTGTDFLTGEIIRGQRTGDNVVGYVGHIELINGFSKTLYMSREEMEDHALLYSQTYKKGYGVWKDMFDKMALKTMLRLIISKYGIMSIDMQSSQLTSAIEKDQTVAHDLDGNTAEYIDAVQSEPMEAVEETVVTDSTPAPKEVSQAQPADQMTLYSEAPLPEDPGF